MQRARSLIEAETSTLVIHMDDRSTDFLKAIYEGKGYPVISKAVSREELAEAIRAHVRVFMLGHGSPSGLFAHNFLIGETFGPLLAEKKDGLYIWCNADAYAVRHKLSGLVSGMFISEVAEAAMFGIKASQQQVDESNAAFSRTVRQILDTGGAYSTVRQCYTHESCQIVKFNSERLYVFNQGSPSPALHPTSYALPYPSSVREPYGHKEEPDDFGTYDDAEIISNIEHFLRTAENPEEAIAEFVWDQTLIEIWPYDVAKLLMRLPQGVAPQSAATRLWRWIDNDFGR